MKPLGTSGQLRSIKGERDEFVRAWNAAIALDQAKAELDTLNRQSVGKGRSYESRRRRVTEKVKALNDRLTPGAKAKAIRWQRVALRIASRHLPTEKAYYYYRIAREVQSEVRDSVSIRAVIEFLRGMGFGRRDRMKHIE